MELNSKLKQTSPESQIAIMAGQDFLFHVLFGNTETVLRRIYKMKQEQGCRLE